MIFHPQLLWKGKHTAVQEPAPPRCPFMSPPHGWFSGLLPEHVHDMGSVSRAM